MSQWTITVQRSDPSGTSHCMPRRAFITSCEHWHRAAIGLAELLAPLPKLQHHTGEDLEARHAVRPRVRLRILDPICRMRAVWCLTFEMPPTSTSIVHLCTCHSQTSTSTRNCEAWRFTSPTRVRAQTIAYKHARGMHSSCEALGQLKLPKAERHETNSRHDRERQKTLFWIREYEKEDGIVC